MCDGLLNFNAVGYTHIKELLSRQSCHNLTQELRDLVAAGKTVNDPQCPKSQSVHGSSAFDSLLEQLTPNIESYVGKRLHPTYAYARLYAPGEELKVHTDRPACEISATITLGFDGDVWPISIGDYADTDDGAALEDELGKIRRVTNAVEIKMGVGDAMLYKGTDKPHWRTTYTQGKWQAQVFLHYVDADGPHAEWRYDKRDKLAHHAPDDVVFYWYYDDAVALSECEKIIEAIEYQTEGEDADVGRINNGVVDKSIRNAKRVSLPTYKGIGAILAGMGLDANFQSWRFDITRANQCDFLKYDKDGHFVPHIDTFLNSNMAECRKLTVLLFLNEDFEGGRFFMECGTKRLYPPQKAGTVLVLPSFLVHGVEPVTNGIRRSIVTWMVGPWFK